MTKKLRRLLLQIVIAALLFAVSLVLDNVYTRLLLLLGTYLLCGVPVILKAFRNIFHGQVFDENFLMMIATFGAIVLGEYTEAAAVMLFFQVGEFFEKYAVNRSRRSIAALMDIRPDYARVYREGKFETVSPEDVAVGEVIEIRSGERVPLDGVVIKGASNIDTAALTGEALPREVAKGNDILSGCINLSGVLRVKTTKEYAVSTVAKILDLVENASAKKAGIENFITRFARWYTPCVVIVALGMAFIPPMLWGSAAIRGWGYRAITFLVISCPCALVISIPLSFFGGIGAASRCGILVKGSNYLEALARTETIVFDKTGTLTKGIFKVSTVKPENGVRKEKVLETAALSEGYSSHPIALSIQKAYGKKLDLARVSKVKEVFGLGITAEIDGVEAFVGNKKMLDKHGVKLAKEAVRGTVIYVGLDGRLLGTLVIEDEIKPDAEATISALKSLGVKLAVILTGDRRQVTAKIARKLKLDKFFAELLPTDKVMQTEKLLAQTSDKGKLVFVGDGINDAPALARADVGIAMGGVGSDAAIEAADVVLMTDEPKQIVTAIRIAKRTLAIAKENIVFALGVKFLVLGLGATGYASIWAAVFADVGVSVIAILNSVRVLYYHKIDNCNGFK